MTRALAALVTVAAGVGALAAVHAAEPSWYARLRYPLEYEAIVRGHARSYRLEPALLAAVIYEESRFRADARSRSGAIGLMQLMPATAKGIALRTGGARFRVADLYDPEINVRYGAWYLRHLLDKYGDLPTALAAYNAGQRRVDEWRRAGRGIRFGETRAYVRAVLATREVYARAYRRELARPAGLRRDT
ncbi:MAG: lytic transglycosylase domain-containing protein [Thermoleophilia bacterium]|nr:lytic transglycosylase domain-containing protein [Thermoleophilia bacterium]